MNFFPLRLLLLAAGAAAAQAGHADTVGLTRAQVMAEFHAFKAYGQDPWSQSYNPLAGFKSQRSRAATQAEAIARRDAVRAANAEDSGSASASVAVGTVSTRTRAEVIAEARARREQVRAMTGEDSGSHFLSLQPSPSPRSGEFAAY